MASEQLLKKYSNLPITPAQLLNHARLIREKYHDTPGFAVKHLEDIIELYGYTDSREPDITTVRLIIDQLRSVTTGPEYEQLIRACSGDEDEVLAKISKEIIFRKKIEEYYLPKQLIDSILEVGEIPQNSIETLIGIGFIDIADYTFLSKFLSPMENQVVLNGLYTAFHWVLKRHGGYLNKIEGDSLMFHFGGVIDPNVKSMEQTEAVKYISRELFYTCVEMQRVCVLFNQANDQFIRENADEQTRETLEKAFEIISMLRNNLELSSSINALFQIRIRIGANIGEVTIGNFGPDGAKQYDVVGLPVIDAKRMETTAPIGGLRISESFYKTLEANGVVESYYNRFQREAMALGGEFRDIRKEELFRFGIVRLKDKRDAVFRTYSIQVNPGLPEAIGEQVDLLLKKGENGADKILELLQYYRGSRYVINAVEKVFSKYNVRLRKWHIMKLIYPKKYQAYVVKAGNSDEKAKEYIDEHYSLFDLLEKFGNYQDKVKEEEKFAGFENNFEGYDSWFAMENRIIKAKYKYKRRFILQKAYFYNIIYPLVFTSIRASILEQQANEKEEELEEL